MTCPDLATLTPLLDQLSLLGEFYLSEVDHRALVWLSLLKEAGWITALSTDGYSATEQYFDVSSKSSAIDLKRCVCFAILPYHRYLVAILAEGLIKASLVNYNEKLEEWITGDLVSLAAEINALIDELEKDPPYILERAPEEVVAGKFAAWHDGHASFADWDRELLGLSGTPDQLFTAVLTRYAKVAFSLTRESEHNHNPIALLPDFSLEWDATGHLLLPTFAPWCAARQSVHSSLPFYDAQGQPLHGADQPVTEIWQDTLALQPYYRAILRVAIAVRYSGYDTEKITLLALDDLENVRLSVAERERGLLVDLLLPLVETLGYRAVMRPVREQVKHLFENWIAVGALEMLKGEIQLTEAYARTLLERRRGQLLLRGQGKIEQEHVKRILKGMA